MTPHIRSGLAVVSTLVVAALSGSAVAQENASPAASPPSSLAAPPATQKTPRELDLRAPDITRVIPAAELERIIAASYRSENIEEVEVEGERMIEATPRVWPGIFAPFWAMANPAQAWRIIAPLPPDQNDGMQYARLDAMETYMLEPAGRPIEPDLFHP